MPAITLEMFCSCEACMDLLRVTGDSQARTKLTLSRTPYGTVMAHITPNSTFVFSPDQKRTVASFMVGTEEPTEAITSSPRRRT